MKSFGVCVAFFCLLSASASAAPPTRGSASADPAVRDDAVAILRATPPRGEEVFALGSVGRGGRPPAKYLAYETILRRSDAPAVFRSLLRVRSSVTQLYALTGLSKCAAHTFRQVAPAYFGRRDSVLVGGGCLRFERRLGDAVRDLAAGRAPNEYQPSQPKGRS